MPWCHEPLGWPTSKTNGGINSGAQMLRNMPHKNLSFASIKTVGAR